MIHIHILQQYNFFTFYGEITLASLDDDGIFLKLYFDKMLTTMYDKTDGTKWHVNEYFYIKYILITYLIDFYLKIVYRHFYKCIMTSFLI